MSALEIPVENTGGLGKSANLGEGATRYFIPGLVPSGCHELKLLKFDVKETISTVPLKQKILDQK